MSLDLQSVFAQFKKTPTTDDRAAQKAAVAEALQVAQASLADGTSVNPPEMAVALEAAVEEIAGKIEGDDLMSGNDPESEEAESEEGEAVEVKPKGAGRKKTATRRAKRKVAPADTEPAPAAEEPVEVTQTDDLPVESAVESSAKGLNQRSDCTPAQNELAELRELQADALDALLKAFAQARDIGLSVELVLK